MTRMVRLMCSYWVGVRGRVGRVWDTVLAVVGSTHVRNASGPEHVFWCTRKTGRDSGTAGGAWSSSRSRDAPDRSTTMGTQGIAQVSLTHADLTRLIAEFDVSAHD